MDNNRYSSVTHVSVAHFFHVAAAYKSVIVKCLLAYMHVQWWHSQDSEVAWAQSSQRLLPQSAEV